MKNLAIQEVKKNLFLKQRYYEGDLIIIIIIHYIYIVLFSALKALYIERGISSTNAMRILAWKLRKKTAENTIHRIREPKTKVIKSKLNEFQESFEVFYKTLYFILTPGCNLIQVDTFLNSLELPTLNEEQNRRMTADISEDELKIAISRLKLNKSPGSDGCTAEWYKEFKNELIPVMLPTLNWVLKKAQTSPSWKEAIPKEGKDKLECGSFKPISVLNMNYRLFTSIMAKRLEEFLPKLIHNDQTGFI